MKRRTIAYSVLCCVVASALFLMYSRTQSAVPKFESARVERGEVANNISVSGHVEPVTRIILAFPSGGRIANVYFKEGDAVLKNTVVAELDGGVLASGVAEAQTRVARERALLRSVLAPVRREERALKDTAVQNAEATLVRAEESARVTLARAFVQADDTIHEAVDELFENAQNSNPEVGIQFTSGSTRYSIKTDSATEGLLNTQRKEVEEVLVAMENRADNKDVSITEALTQTNQDLLTIQGFLTTLAEVVNRYSSNDTTEQTVYETFQTSITGARTTINSARSEVSTAFNTYTSAESALSLALRDLELSDAGATREAIEAQEAALASAEASVRTAREQKNNTILTSPLEGVLSRVNFEPGEAVSPYEPVAELITKEAYEVEAYVPEADIARLKLGDIAEVTFDAYEKSDVLTAEVVRIALSETVRDGVPTYKTTLRIVNDGMSEDMILRPGMTADIEIQTDLRENVLYVPIRTIIKAGSRTYVRIFDGVEFKERDVVVGLRGSEGTVEIISGVTEGEEVVIYVEEA